MARFIPKQFAENSTTSVVFGSFQEQGGNVGDGTISNDPATLQGGTAWPLGWKAATDNFFQIPRGEEMEGLERVLSAAIIQQFKDGLTFWQSEMPVTQYQTIVQYQTGSDHPKLYINITGTSTSTPPDSDTTNWYMFLDTGASFANVDLSNLSATGEAKIAGVVPTGSIILFGGTTAPEGYLICNGGAISRTTYADLFDAIGTLYGAGDGSTTFNLPNFNGRYPLGGTSSGAYVGESLPIPTHYHTFNVGNGETTAEAPDLGIPIGGTFNTNGATGFSAPYSAGAKVRPDSLTIIYCIKY